MTIFKTLTYKKILVLLFSITLYGSTYSQKLSNSNDIVSQFDDYFPLINGNRTIELVKSFTSEIKPEIVYLTIKESLIKIFRQFGIQNKLISEDKENLILIGESYLNFKSKKFLSKEFDKMYYRYEIKVKEGKFRIRFFDFDNQAKKNASSNPLYKSNSIDSIYQQYRSNVNLKINQQIINNTYNQLKSYLNSIIEAIN